MPCTLPSLFASVRSLTAVPRSPRASTEQIRPANPMPSTIAAVRCPRSVSISASDESRPTSISTNRNSMMIAPVYTMICTMPMNGPACST